MAGTFAASTCKSGSATVMITPSRKLRIRIRASLRERVMLAPMCVPICVMDRSEPTVNRPMPMMIMTEPIKNESISALLTGIRNRHSAATISVIGRTDATDSRIFSVIIFLLGNLASSPCLFFSYVNSLSVYRISGRIPRSKL